MVSKKAGHHFRLNTFKLDLAFAPLKAKYIAIVIKPKVGRSTRAEKALLIQYNLK